MNEVTRRFSSTVFITLGSTFGLHTLLNYFIDQPLFQNMIVESYSVILNLFGRQKLAIFKKMALN